MDRSYRRRFVILELRASFHKEATAKYKPVPDSEAPLLRADA